MKTYRFTATGSSFYDCFPLSYKTEKHPQHRASSKVKINGSFLYGFDQILYLYSCQRI